MERSTEDFGEFEIVMETQSHVMSGFTETRETKLKWKKKPDQRICEPSQPKIFSL